MRKNVNEVFLSWLELKPCNKYHSIHTDGKKIYSYDTPIVVRDDNGHILINESKYSVTTSHQVNSIVDRLENDYNIGLHFVDVKDKYSCCCRDKYFLS